MASSWGPVTVHSPGPKIPAFLAMDAAVSGWSPVIITGRIPASFAVATAALVSGRRGSVIAAIPIKVSPCSHFFGSPAGIGPSVSSL